MVKTKLELVDKSSFDKLLSEFKEKVSHIPKLVPLIYSASEIRKSLLERDEMLRSAMLQYGFTPKFSYIVYSEGDSFLITIVRKSKSASSLYKDFVFRFSLKSVHSLQELQKFQDGIFIRLLEESILYSNLEYFNNLIKESSLNSSYTVEFSTDIFFSGYVSYISNDRLVLTADSESLFSLVEAMKASDETRVRELESNSLIVCQSTVEVLGRKSPIISYLLNSGKIGLKKLLKPVYSKTIRQMNTYKSSKGYGYYLEGNSFGVVNRTEYGVDVVLDVYNLETFEKEDYIDLVSEVG